MVVKKFSFLVALTLIISIFTGCTTKLANQSQDKEQVKIGITQIIEHPALDSARKGFIDELKANGFEEGKNLVIDYKSAQGDIPTTQSIAQGFVASKVDMILAIATPSAQSAFNVTKDIPILITAVTDAVKAGLVKSNEKTETNVTGTSDSVSVEEQIEFINKVLPNAKKVGVLYNTSEINSEVQINGAKEACEKLGFELVKVGITSVNDVSQAINSLVGKVDVVFTQTDNLIASAMPVITNECYKKNIPVIGSEKAHVEAGAVASIGIDYYKLGQQTAKMAVEVINGKKPQDMGIGVIEEMQVSVNTDAVKKLNLKFSDDLLKGAEEISGGVN